ncbi:MAG: nucleotidyltransferase domain-containing protein [Novosphingobium sp.]|nr:nucleotidyltransferase domain-containing protein [Novosphingobium sp.]
MPEQLPNVWLEEIQAWASGEPLVLEAYIFGSRAKGIARPESDLDVAILLAGGSESERTANWICEASRLRKGLEERLPVSLDLWSIAADDERVGPAVREHGILAFRRGA